MMKEINSKKRNMAFDMAKGIAILLMIYDHIVGQGKIITSFHMPIFFIIAGYFLKEESIKITIVKKTKRLLVPYLEYNILALLVGIVKEKCIIHASVDVVRQYVKDKLINIFMARDIWLLWFLLCLFETIIIYTFIKTIIKKVFWRNIVIFLIFLLGYYLSIVTNGNAPYYIDLGLFAVIFVAIGDALKQISWKSLEKWKKYGIYFSLCMIWIAGIHYGLFVMALRIFDRFPLCVVSAIAGSFVVIISCMYIQNIPMIPQLLAWWGRNTMKVLCLANIFRAFIWWQGVCREYLHINNIIVMFMVQATVIAIIVCGWNCLQNKRHGNIKRLRKGNE